MSTSITSTKLRIGSTSQQKVKESTVLKQLGKLRKLDLAVDELILYKVDITEAVLESFGKLLIRDGRHFSIMKLVSCIGHEQQRHQQEFHNNNNNNNTLAQLVQLICDFSSVKTLVLSGTTDVPTLLALEQGMRTNTSIHTLRILGAQFVDDATADGLQGFLSVNLTLEELDLSKSHLSPIAVKALSMALRRNSQLTTLSLEECHLEDACLAQITSACEHVESLCLAHNAAHTETLDAITNLVTSSAGALRCLNLSHQHLGEAGVTADSAARTARWQAMKGALMHALEVLPSAKLTTLDISNNHLDDMEVMDTLCRTLASPSCPLEHVDISDCDISHSGMHVVAQHLQTFETVKTLNVAHNDHNEATLDDLVQGLRHNRILSSLGPLEGVVGEEHPEVAQKLQHYLDLNVAGRRALQQDIPLAVWPLLLAQGQRKVFGGEADEDEEHAGRAETVLFSMLRGPALFQR